MTQTKALQQFNEQDLAGSYVYLLRDLRKLFLDDSDRAFRAGLRRLVVAHILIRAANGVYVYAFSRHLGPNTLELVARTLRRGEYSYVSLESALSEYGAISQIPVDRLTVMTTGRKGEYVTPYGTIEFTHTSRSIIDILDCCVDIGRPLKVAEKKAAYRDLKRVGRNVHLVEEAVVYESEA